MWHCNTCSDVFASMNFISYRSIWQESSTLKPNLWILLLRILPLTHYSTSCCIITDEWSSGTYLGLEISSRFVLSLICHCIWEVLFAHSLELTELPYFLCWILYLFFKKLLSNNHSQKDILHPNPSHGSQSVTYRWRFFSLFLVYNISLFFK